MNWKQIISDLSDRGYTQPKLAQACGCGQATISDMATGKTKSPRYEVGAKLLELAKVGCTDPQPQAEPVKDAP